jgi:membrane-associated protease RseP (regulator of RpoE activity)
MTHFIMAFVLLFAMLAIPGQPVAAVPEVTALPAFAHTTSPARAAGLRPGDEFVSLDGIHYATADQFVEAIRAHPGVVMTLVVRRGGKLVTTTLHPVDGRTVNVKGGGTLVPASTKPTGVIGVDLDYLTRNEPVGPLTAFGRAGSMLGSSVALSVRGIGDVFSLHGLSSFAHQVATAGHNPGAPSTAGSAGSSSSNNQQIESVVGIVQIGAQLARQNIAELLYLLALVNIFIGIVNLVPMLPLDGGHVAIAIYERVRSRRGQPYHADVAKLMPVAYAFVVFMLVLGLGALYVNILQPAHLPGS